MHAEQLELIMADVIDTNALMNEADATAFQNELVLYL